MISGMKQSDLSDENKAKVQNAKKIVNAIKTDGSSGIHNYMVFSSLLDKMIKDLKTITNEGK